MKIFIISYGTRGDVQPSLALGKSLQAHGHSVRMLAGQNFASWIRNHGLEAIPAQVDIQALMMSESGLEWVEEGHNLLRQIAAMKQLAEQHGMTMMADAWQAAQGAEVIISSFTSDVYAVAIAEKLGVRLISTPLQPAMFATRYGPAIPGAPLPRRKSLVNLVFSKLFLEPFRWRITGKLVNQFRRQVLNLPEQTATENLEVLRRTPTVQAYSRHVVPPPDDWPANFHTAGYWFLDEHSSWQPPPALADFLQAGDPPVYVGFGSMTGRNPQALTQILVEAITQSGQRAILQSGWAGMGRTPLPDSVFRLDTAPHSWLFPRMKVIVHHGGAGTTGESLRAGVPTLVIPTMSDQPYWGQRVAALGAGPPPIPRHQLTTSKLAAAIQQAATDRKMQANAVALGQCIRAEDGLSLGMRLIEQYLG